MTSQINYAAITTNYPVAGVDNDSQGFRDNFTAISAGLATAKAELTALQSNAILKADLATSSSQVQNDMLGSTIYNALYNRFYGVFFNGGTIPSTATIDLQNGPAQKFILSGNATLTFDNWPSSGYAVARVLISSDQNGVRTPTFATSNAGTIRYDVGYPTLPGSSNPGFKVGGESVSTISVTNPGDGYITSAAVNFTSPTQTGGTLPTAVATYKVVSATVTSGQAGTGYAVGNRLVVNERPDVILNVTGVSGGAITNVSVSSGGNLSLPLVGDKTVTALSGTGTGASVRLNCGINTIVVTNAGDGYTTVPPTVTIDPSSGTQALATAALTSNTNDNPKVIEAWTVDGGSNVYIRFVGEYN